MERSSCSHGCQVKVISTVDNQSSIHSDAFRLFYKFLTFLFLKTIINNYICKTFMILLGQQHSLRVCLALADTQVSNLSKLCCQSKHPFQLIELCLLQTNTSYLLQIGENPVCKRYGLKSKYISSWKEATTLTRISPKSQVKIRRYICLIPKHYIQVPQNGLEGNE